MSGRDGPRGARFTLRQARAGDAAALARLHRASRAAAMPWLKETHTEAATAAFMSGSVLAHDDVRIAEAGGAIAGYSAVNADWLNHLYVAPEFSGCGAGGLLLGEARRGKTHLMLWVFQRNFRARRFYETRGFTLLSESDGRGNEEREPDALYEWRA